MLEFYLNNRFVRIGSNAKENWELIDTLKRNDIWVHLKDVPSCHAVIRLPKKCRDNNMILTHDLNHTARMVCINSSKHIKNNKMVDVIYIKGKYVKKGKTEGEANLLTTPEIITIENPNYM
jgi:predicted ribosome quality control (RQC) complex YloA/Tae2 family protein